MNKQVKITAFIGISLILLVILLFCMRGWLRESFIPNTVAGQIKSSLNRSYESSYDSTREALSNLNLELSEKEVASCSLLSAEKLTTTILCSSSSGNKKQRTDDYVELFKEQSLETEKLLQENGWIKAWNQAQPISELFDNSENAYTVGVNYEKSYQGSKCKISIFYNAWESPKTMYYNLSCSEYVDYFLFIKSS